MVSAVATTASFCVRASTAHIRLPTTTTTAAARSVSSLLERQKLLLSGHRKIPKRYRKYQSIGIRDATAVLAGNHRWQPTTIVPSRELSTSGPGSRHRSVFPINCKHYSSSPRQFSSSSVTNNNDNSNDNLPSNKKFRWLNLEDAGLSMLERLSLEEYLLKHTRDNWILVGRHSVWPPKHLSVPQKKADGHDGSKKTTTNNNSRNNNNVHLKMLPDYITETKTTGSDQPSPNGMIVMGIGGKAEKLLNAKEVQTDRMLVVKRFSGGGTVVMDENAIWTTLIAGRRDKDGSATNKNDSNELCKPWPREIMEWTANAVFEPTFHQLNAQTQQSTTATSPGFLPRFSLREDDYVLTVDGNNETRKMGGNAQAISGRHGWLHHTSFLWDYDDVNMERYLKLPEKRPEYRVDRSHRDFLAKLKDYYDSQSESEAAPTRGPSFFVDCMKKACSESVGIEETNWSTVYREVFDSDDARLQAWWLENRTRIQHDL